MKELKVVRRGFAALFVSAATFLGAGSFLQAQAPANGSPMKDHTEIMETILKDPAAITNQPEMKALQAQKRKPSEKEVLTAALRLEKLSSGAKAAVSRALENASPERATLSEDDQKFIKRISDLIDKASSLGALQETLKAEEREYSSNARYGPILRQVNLMVEDGAKSIYSEEFWQKSVPPPPPQAAAPKISPPTIWSRVKKVLKKDAIGAVTAGLGGLLAGPEAVPVAAAGGAIAGSSNEVINQFWPD